jgi:hypothetical protein
MAISTKHANKVVSREGATTITYFRDSKRIIAVSDTDFKNIGAAMRELRDYLKEKP